VWSIIFAELQNRKALTEDIPVLPFAELQAEKYGAYRALSTRKKAVLDIMIAAHAYTESCVLVTNNEKDFTYFPDLVVENWVENID
jgi:tRNA(fMet)-specific endonuclease VapC